MRMTHGLLVQREHVKEVKLLENEVLRRMF